MTSADVQKLVGKWFHTYEEPEQPGEGRVMKWQGKVISSPAKGYFLVQLFSWLMGEPTTQKIVRFDDMRNWDFYSSFEEKEAAWRRYEERRAQRLEQSTMEVV